MSGEILQVQAHGVGLVIDARGSALPRVLHWGEALGDLSQEELVSLAAAMSRQSAPGTLDAAWQLSILPQEGDGWTGRPGLQVRRAGVLHHCRWQAVTASVEVTADGARCRVTARDAASALELDWTVGVEAGGVVWVNVALSVAADAPDDGEDYEVDWLEATLPVPTSTTHLTTFDGRWTREKRPVTTGMPAGSTVRQSRRGRPGHDTPVFFIASVAEPRWRSGALWATHLAWSSDATYRVDRVTDAVTLIGAGELLRPGEMVLRGGETYRAPRAAFVWAPAGLDAMAGRLHTWMRQRPQHPHSPRPLTLNTWEAVYFDHDPARIGALAERAAAIGVERFVLDDGWFLGRRNDTTSLGDWVVDRAVWPDGLGPLAAKVHGLGMEFGLWFEPEMVSADSEVARAHPEWLLHDPGHLDHDAALSWRTQYVMDLANPEAYEHVRGEMDALVAELGIDFIKWDHNRDLTESVHAGRPGTHAQMHAAYRLIADLKSAHEGLEIESCSSGGARTDLGIMAVCDRVWASDSNDPVERQDIQLWTGLLLPPELVGAHVGPVESHSSGRTTDLSYRMATSLLGSAGFEWDILECTDDEVDALTRFGELYRELRPFVHGGTVVHPELRDAAWRVTGFIAPGAGRAVVIVATVASLEDARAERLRIPGLDSTQTYRVRVRREIGAAKYGWIAPEWFTRGETTLPGAVLERVGLQLPTLWPTQAFVLDLEVL